MAILGVSEDGALMQLGRFVSPSGGHCVVSDQQGHACVCDPKCRGGLVGAAGIEPATTCSQSRYATAALRPEGSNYPTEPRDRAPRPDPLTPAEEIPIIPIELR